MARGSNLALVVRFDDLPFLTEAERLVQQQFVTGASARNWASYAESVTLPGDFPEWRRQLLTDPQTSGGLLIACDPARAAEVARTIADAGYPRACISDMPRPGHRQSRLGPERCRSGLATFSKSAATCVRWAGLAPTPARAAHRIKF